jgi:phosphonate transport system ATP-binding protein
MDEGSVLLDVRGLRVCYPNGVHALSGVDVQVRGGELAVVLGSNGSGKSTLLRCIVRLLEPNEGEIRVRDRDLSRLRGVALRDARRDVALVAQHANLVRRRSVLANVACGALGRRRDVLTSLGMLPREDLRFAYEQLRVVGLADRAAQSAGTLSGGQAQRVAIARSLAQRPTVLLADEPVASLDPDAAHDVLALLRRLANEGLAVLCVLHQPELALRYADRLIGMRAGRIAFDTASRLVNEPLIASLYAGDAAA